MVEYVKKARIFLRFFFLYKYIYFRYGREDEEVMGLKFCNEAVMCLAQLYPPHPAMQQVEGNTPLQVSQKNKRKKDA